MFSKNELLKRCCYSILRLNASFFIMQWHKVKVLRKSKVSDLNSTGIPNVECSVWHHNDEITRLCFYQTRSAWSMDQGSNRKHSAVHNFAPTVTKFCVIWEGQALPHDTKFSNCRCEIVGRRVIFIWSLIPGSSWSGLIKAEPGFRILCLQYDCWIPTGFS